MDEEQKIDIRIKELIGQQLPDLEKLVILHDYVQSVRDTTLKKEVAAKAPDYKKLDSLFQELKAKLNELLETPYSVELLLLILPILIEAKKTT